MSSLQWQNILVAVADPFATEQPALAKAAAIARRCGAALTVFNAFMVPQMLAASRCHTSEEVLAAASSERQERLRKLTGKLRLQQPAKCVVRWDYPSHEAIVRQVLRSKADLLVTDSHRHRRLARLVLANTDWELIRSCPCPLWFVRSPQLPRRPKVLVAVDPSHAHAKPSRLDNMLLRGAQALVQQLGGCIDMLHVHQTSSDLLSMVSRRAFKLLRQEQALPAATARELHKLAQAFSIEAADCHVRVGAVGEVIVRSTQRFASDVLVMGAVSRSRVAAAMIGSTAERVIDHVDCDVLIIKPAGFVTQVARRVPTLPSTDVNEDHTVAA